MKIGPGPEPSQYLNPDLRVLQVRSSVIVKKLLLCIRRKTFRVSLGTVNASYDRYNGGQRLCQVTCGHLPSFDVHLPLV